MSTTPWTKNSDGSGDIGIMFNLDDWPDDGTDWDGVHDKVMKKILEYKEKAEKWTNFENSSAGYLESHKIVSRLKKLKTDTKAILSNDSPNKEELEHVLNLLNFALGEEK